MSGVSQHQIRTTKNPPANRRAELGNELVVASGGEDLGNLRVDLDGVRMVAFDAVELMAALQHAVEFVDEHGDGLVALVGPHGSVQVGTVDLDVALGGELGAVRRIAIALQFDADAVDALVMAKQAFGLVPDERLERRSQIEVNAGDNDIAVVLAVHVSSYGFGCGKAGNLPGLAVKIRLPRQRRALAQRSAPTIRGRRSDGRIFRYWKIIYQAGRKCGAGSDHLQSLAAFAGRKYFR